MITWQLEVTAAHVLSTQLCPYTTATGQHIGVELGANIEACWMLMESISQACEKGANLKSGSNPGPVGPPLENDLSEANKKG